MIYKLGDVIADSRYTGNEYIGRCIDDMPYTPNIDWQSPKYRPFSIDELALVHVSDQDAKNGVLKPQSYIPLEIQDTLSGKTTNWFYPRETLHFTLNGLVDDHTGGQVSAHTFSWKNKKFAYVIPLVDVIDQVISLFTHDTIILGQLELPSSTQIISQQSESKVKSVLQKKGYQFLDIRGVKELDPAYLNEANINHPLNFSQITQQHEIDGAYTSPSINNIHVLDEMTSMVFAAAARNNSLLIPHEEMVEELENRVNYFTKRFAKKAIFTQALDRLAKGVERYVEYVKALKQWEDSGTAFRTIANTLPDDDYMRQNRSTRAERKSINEQLLWNNNE
jgi:hypothetical protein